VHRPYSVAWQFSSESQAKTILVGRQTRTPILPYAVTLRTLRTLQSEADKFLIINISAV